MPRTWPCRLLLPEAGTLAALVGGATGAPSTRFSPTRAWRRCCPCAPSGCWTSRTRAYAVLVEAVTAARAVSILVRDPEN